MLRLVSLLIRCYNQLIRRCFSFCSSSTLVYGFLCTCVCVYVCGMILLVLCTYFFNTACSGGIHNVVYAMLLVNTKLLAIKGKYDCGSQFLY